LFFIDLPAELFDLFGKRHFYGPECRKSLGSSGRMVRYTSLGYEKESNPLASF